MRLFVCSYCSNMVYFENRSCERCGNRLGYLPASNKIHALEPAGDDWLPLGDKALKYRFCANAEYDACNWLVAADSADRFCVTCRHNRTIPNLSVPGNLCQWRKWEFAKHHMFYGLLRLRLPLETRLDQPEFGLAFDVLVDDPNGAESVLTGHREGVITLHLAEADDAMRERLRTQLGEPYRTLLGHLRHEIAHYYWDRLVRDRDDFGDFRDIFGDERLDYGEALKTYYTNGPPDDWREHYISAYACAHPWEDFAETWAHFLHIVDTLEMASSFGLRVDPGVTEEPAHSAEVDFDPHDSGSADLLVRRWLPIARAVNSINRCMGQPDLYPFVVTPTVIGKLRFVHRLIRRTCRSGAGRRPSNGGDLR